MNKIKAAIVKDLLQLKSYRKTLIIFMVVFMICSFLQINNGGIQNLIIPMMVLGLGMFSIATFSYDEAAKSDKYILSMPITRKEVVISKYILIMLSTFIGAIIGIVLSIVVIYLMKGEIVNIIETITIGLGSIAGIGFVHSIQIPFIYKYGVEKGRVQIITAVAIIGLIIGGIIYIQGVYDFNLFTSEIINMLMNFLPLILLVLILVMYYISYLFSYKILLKKEL